MGIRSSFQTIALSLNSLRSYWTCTLSTGKELSERGMIFDFRAGGLRPLDWSLDLVSTSDILKLREVVLHCPDGNEGHLKIDEPGTAFQFKIATMHEGHAKRQTECQLIGKVTDKVSGACLCYIYDKVEGLIEYTSTIYNFGTWRTGILPLTALNCDVLGLRM